jgi:hypothetical protein
MLYTLHNYYTNTLGYTSNRLDLGYTKSNHGNQTADSAASVHSVNLAKLII